MPQQRLSDLILLSDTINVSIFILEVRSENDIIFRKLNQFHEQATGMSSAAIEGKRPHDILPQRVADTIMGRYQVCVRAQEPQTYEELLNLPTGERWWQTTLSPIFFDDGSVIGLFGTSVDITAQKEREVKDAQVISHLRELNDEVNMYTSMVAHDVRGPLRKIRVMSELAFEDIEPDDDSPLILDADQKALVANIGAVAAKTLEHVDSILSYSRALSLDPSPTLEVLDLHAFFADLIAVLDPDAAYTFDFPKETVRVERIVLQVVLRNLLENAVRHAKFACHVALAVDEDTSSLVFIVSDDGEGFSDETIFKDRSATSRMKSATTGFGLNSAQRMVEARHCKIWLAQSHFGSGGSVAFSTQGQLVD
ncbi:MAG: PAS domain-containing sensor histidine kinase [Devosiaceae bacterium]